MLSSVFTRLIFNNSMAIAIEHVQSAYYMITVEIKNVQFTNFKFCGLQFRGKTTCGLTRVKTTISCRSDQNQRYDWNPSL